MSSNYPIPLSLFAAPFQKYLQIFMSCMYILIESLPYYQAPDWANLFPINEDKSDFVFLFKIHSSLSTFFLALSQEFGVFHKPNLNQSFKNYFAAADEKNWLSNLRLFFIYAQETDKFGLNFPMELPVERSIKGPMELTITTIEPSIERSIWHLIRSAAYYEGEFSSFADPISILRHLINTIDPDLLNLRLIIKKHSGNKTLEATFLTHWLMMKFSSDPELAAYHMEELEILAENELFPESCLILAQKLSQNPSSPFLLTLYSTAASAGVGKACFGFAELLGKEGKADEALAMLKRGGKLGCGRCMRKLAEYYREEEGRREEGRREEEGWKEEEERRREDGRREEEEGRREEKEVRRKKMDGARKKEERWTRRAEVMTEIKLMMA